jgi:hypothetical protein
MMIFLGLALTAKKKELEPVVGLLPLVSYKPIFEACEPEI